MHAFGLWEEVGENRFKYHKWFCSFRNPDWYSFCTHVHELKTSLICIRSLDEIHQNRRHSPSPSRYHDAHLEHQRSGDSDYEYSEDRYLQPTCRENPGAIGHILLFNKGLCATVKCCSIMKKHTKPIRIRFYFLISDVKGLKYKIFCPCICLS